MRESPLAQIWDGNKLVGVQMTELTAAGNQPDQFDLELVRIFDEHKALTAEVRGLKIDLEEAHNTFAEITKDWIAENKALTIELDQHRWIPVSERPPEEHKKYAVRNEKEWWEEEWGFVDHGEPAGWECSCFGEITHYKPIILQ